MSKCQQCNFYLIAWLVWSSCFLRLCDIWELVGANVGKELFLCLIFLVCSFGIQCSELYTVLGASFTGCLPYLNKDVG